ncbi:MAG: cupin domain-containing protein [Gemmataceae bacterium]
MPLPIPKQKLFGEVSLVELGKLLGAFRRYRDISIPDVVERFHALIKKAKDDDVFVAEAQWLAWKKNLPIYLKKVEDGRNLLTRKPESLYLLARAYGIPALMVDPLLSIEVNDYCLVQSLQKDFLRPSAGPRPFDGKYCSYRIPEKRLEGTDAYFVDLCFQPGGESDAHDHPGDELLLVLKGRVEVVIESSGIRQILDEGEYIHFHSEQRHFAAITRRTKNARVFVIRFFQLQKQGAGHDDIRSALREMLKILEEPDPSLQKVMALFSEKKKVILPWLSQMIMDSGYLGESSLEGKSESHLRKTKSGELLLRDPVGLGAMLTGLKRMFGPTYRDLADQSKKARKQLHGILHGKSRKVHSALTHVDLDALAAMFGSEVPSILLYGFLFPAVQYVATVRRSDLHPVMPPLQVPDNAHYKLPARTLAGSDINVTYVDLDSNTSPETQGETPWNRHPGFELVLPLQGKVRIDFRAEERQETVDSAMTQYAHYASDRCHRVVNVGSETAKVFVIRFNVSNVDTGEKKRPPTLPR